MNWKTLPLESIWHPAKSSARLQLQPAPRPQAHPLLVVLHGRGDSAQGYDYFPAAMNLPDINYLMLQAPDPYGTTEFGGPGFSWYDHPPDQGPGVLRSRQLLTTAFEQIERAGFKPSQTFLLGFSQGCLMTLEFGARYPKPLAGCIGISGYVYDVEALIAEASPAARAGAFFVDHGLQDDVLPIATTRAQIQRLKAAGLNIDYREYQKTHTIDEGQELDDIRAWIKTRIIDNSL